MNQFFCQMLMQTSKLIHSESFKTRNITSEKAFTCNRKRTFPVMSDLSAVKYADTNNAN